LYVYSNSEYVADLFDCYLLLCLIRTSTVSRDAPLLQVFLFDVNDWHKQLLMSQCSRLIHFAMHYSLLS